MRSQTLLAQKPKRVGRHANVGAKVRNINETVKLFGNFLFFNNFFAWFEGCLSTVHLIKWEVSHGTISPAKAAYLRESSGTGSLHDLSPVPPKKTCGLFARRVGKVSVMTALQYINYINNKPIGRIKYALI